MKNYKYDIFISYKHEALDKAVAARLQKSLEHYKIPKEIQKKTGKEKIKRVFRDEEELAVSSDLGKEIEGQIAQSEYLLVVCSKKTKESQWVLKEIDTFLKYRDAEHILPVLIEGEPEESLPESILVYGEPMAADVRGKNEKEVLKKVKKELPRIIAPVLQCSYDELKQRARNYQIKRMLIGTSVALVAVASFAAYAVFQSARLNKEYQETRRNQARNMAQTSEKLLEQGDRIGALKTALAVLPENENSKEALVPEQMGALNNALYSYTVEKQPYFRPIRAENIEDDLEGGIRWSPDKKYYMVLNCLGYIYFFDGKTGKCIWKEFGKSFNKKIRGFYGAAFLDNDTVILLSEGKISIVDFKEKSVKKIINLGFKIEDIGIPTTGAMGDGCGRFGICTGEDRIIIAGGDKIVSYSLKTGKKEFELKRDKLKQSESMEISGLLYMEKSNHIIVGIRGFEEAGGVFSYSIKDETIRQISDKDTITIYGINDKYIAALQDRKIPTVSKGAVNYDCQLCIYNYQNGEKKWSKNKLSLKRFRLSLNWKIEEMEINRKKEKVALFSFQNTVYCISLKDFKVINKKQYDGHITGLDKYDDNNILVGTADGKIYLYCDPFVEKKVVEQIGDKYIDKGGIQIESGWVEDFSYSQVTNTVTQRNRTGNMIVTSGNLRDCNVSKISVNKKIESIQYFSVDKNGEQKSYKAIWYRKGNADKQKISIYKKGISKEVYQVESSEEKKCDYFTIGQLDGEIVLCYIEIGNIEDVIKVSKENLKVHIVNLEEGKEIKTYEITDLLSYSIKIAYSKDLSCIWVGGELKDSSWPIKSCIKQIRVLGNEVKEINLGETESKDFIDQIYVSPNNDYVAVAYNGSKEDYLKIWDVKKAEWEKINKSTKIKNIYGGYYYSNKQSITFGKVSNQIAVCKKDDTIEIIDLDERKIKHKILEDNEIQREYDGYGENTIEFLDNDKYMVTLDNQNNVSVWNLQKEKRIMQQKLEYSIWNPQIQVENNYFLIQSEGDVSSCVYIFITSKDNSFIKYAYISEGYGDVDAGEIIISSEGNFYLSKIYDFQELKKEALKVLDGETLTKEEKRKYFLEE